MALTSPHMALRIWNLITDLFDHDQLADNFAKLDLHDHTLGRGVQIPSDGIMDGAITATKLATALDPSPAYTTWKINRHVGGSIPNGATIGTAYMLPLAPSSGVAIAGTASSALGFPFYIDPAEFNVSGRTTVFRIRNTVLTNATAPASTFTFAIQPVATWNVGGPAAGTLGNVGTLGGQVVNSTAAVVAPAAMSAGATTPASPVFSGEFQLSAGWYVASVTISVSNAAAITTGYTTLQYRQI